MSVREYIGARYVPVFANPVTWNQTSTYEALTMVTWEGATYTSRQPVPAGIDITNTNYWIVTGNYNAQVESYRQEVQRLAQDVASFDGEVDAEALARQQADEQLSQNLASEVQNREGADTQLAADIAGETQARKDADEQITSNIESIENANKISHAAMLMKSHELQGAIPIYRYEVPFPYSTQGNCYFEDQGRRFWALAYYNRDTMNTTAIHIIDIDAKLTYTIPGDFVHCNQMVYDDTEKQLVVSGVRNQTDQHIHCIKYDMTVPQAPSLVSDTVFDTLWFNTYEPVQVFIIDENTYGVHCYISGTDGTVRYAVCSCAKDFTNRQFLYAKDTGFTSIANVYQSMTYSPSLDAVLFTIGGKVQMISLNGDDIDSITFKHHYSYVTTSEVEAFFEYNGKFYFGNTKGTFYSSAMSFIANMNDNTNVLTLFEYDPNKPDATVTTLENNANITFYLNSNQDGLATNNNVFKYPFDLANALEDNAGKYLTVTLQTDIPFIIPITARCDLKLGNYKCRGVLMYADCWLSGGTVFSSDPTYSLIRTIPSRGSIPVLALAYPTTDIYWEGITPAAGNYYAIFLNRAHLVGNNQLYDSGNWSKVSGYITDPPVAGTGINIPPEV